MLHVRALWDRHLRIADEDERRLARRAILPARPVVEELVHPLALDDPPDVQEERPLDGVTLPESLGSAIVRNVDADPDDVVRDARVAEDAVDHRALLLRVEGDRARRVKQRSVNRKTDRGLLVSRRHEHRAVGNEREPERRWQVDICEEQSVIDLGAALVYVFEQLRHVRPLLAHEGALVVERGPAGEGGALVAPEVTRAALLDAES